MTAMSFKSYITLHANNVGCHSGEPTKAERITEAFLDKAKKHLQTLQSPLDVSNQPAEAAPAAADLAKAPSHTQPLQQMVSRKEITIIAVAAAADSAAEDITVSKSAASS